MAQPPQHRQYKQPIYYKQFSGKNNKVQTPIVAPNAQYNYPYVQPIYVLNAPINYRNGAVNNAPNTVIVREKNPNIKNKV